MLRGYTKQDFCEEANYAIKAAKKETPATRRSIVADV